MSRCLKVAILTVSDTCAKDASQDKTGPKLASVFQAQTHRAWQVAKTATCPDDIDEIQGIIKTWTDQERYDLVVTAGGTGFAVRDVTPEAVKSLLDKEAPGLVHAMLRTSFDITPFAAMARPVAGVRKGTVIVTVPGSVKGAVENIEAIIKLLPHATDLASDAGNSREMHADGPDQIAREAGLPPNQSTNTKSRAHDHSHTGHVCKHEHVSNDPSLSVTKRARESPYAMTSVENALKLVLAQTPAPQKSMLPICGQDQYLMADYFVAQDLYALEQVPAYRASIVDGYAVISTDGPGTFPVVSVSHANDKAVPHLQSGQIVRITTGAPLPPSADSVIMVEDTTLISSTEDGKEEKEVSINVTTVAGDNIREPGSDLAKDTLVMSLGERITATGGEIGLLASAGYTEIPIYRKPVIGVLSTGDEVIDPSTRRALQAGEIRDSNRIALLSTLRAHHFSPIDLGIARDSPHSLENLLRRASTHCDVIITTGGVSMGELDLLKPTLERTLRGTIHFGRVAMKPGKPTTFATIPKQGSSAGKVLVFALPGNPASALVTYTLFVLPALRKLSGHKTLDATDSTNTEVFDTNHTSLAPRVTVVLSHDIKLDPRPEFHRVTLRVSDDGVLCATSTGMQRSSRVASLRCTALLCLPARTDTLAVLKAGETCRAIMVDRL